MLNSQTWNQNQITLCSSANGDLTQLPWAAQLHLIWKGILADGTPLADGTYNLCAQVKDGDNNVFPDTSDATTGTCVDFKGIYLVSLLGNHTIAFFQSFTAKPVKSMAAQIVVGIWVVYGTLITK